MSRWEREGHGNHVFRAEIRHCFFLQNPFLLNCSSASEFIWTFPFLDPPMIHRSRDLNNLRRPMDMNKYMYICIFIIYICIYYE